MVVIVTYSEKISVPGATLTLNALQLISKAISDAFVAWVPDLIHLREQQIKDLKREDPDFDERLDELQQALTLLETSVTQGCETSLWSARTTNESGGTHKLQSSQLADLLPSHLEDLVSAEIVFTCNLGGYDNPKVELVMADNTVHVSFDYFDAPLPSLTERTRAALEETITDEMREKLKLSDRIFLGHGGDNKWKTVAEILERGGYSVEAFETNDRTGSGTFFEVLNMIKSSRIAVVVMTGADKLADPERKLLARQNVVHEIGLAQGILGSENTIILMEDNVEEFSNIHGITQLRVPAGDLFSSKDQLLTAVKAKLRG